MSLLYNSVSACFPRVTHSHPFLRGDSPLPVSFLPPSATFCSMLTVSCLSAHVVPAALQIPVPSSFPQRSFNGQLQSRKSQISAFLYRSQFIILSTDANLFAFVYGSLIFIYLLHRTIHPQEETVPLLILTTVLRGITTKWSFYPRPVSEVGLRWGDSHMTMRLEWLTAIRTASSL